MGINRAGHLKKLKTGAKSATNRKHRKYEMGRSPSNTKLGEEKVKAVRVRGGHMKFRALRLDHGNFSWGSKGITRPTKIIDVVYNASNNELVRTKTLVKNAIVVIDATPFKQYYEQNFGITLARVKSEEKKEVDSTTQALWNTNRKDAHIEKPLKESLIGGRVLACISSRPGQIGRADGYILEGEELAFYQKKTQKKRK